MRDIKYQLKKATKTLTDLKTVILEEYHKFLDVFSKKTSDTLFEHSKYNYRIRFLEGYKDYGNSLFQAIFEPKLQFVKKFLEENLKKEFIKASNALCLSPIMLAVKPSEGVRFCVDYRRLNKLIVKDAYPIPLIKKTLVQLKNAKVFMKIDIRQAFHKLQMVTDSEDYITFLYKFSAFKWKVLPFGLTGAPTSWQRFINDMLWKYFNKFYPAYLNDILIYSNNLREHKEHMRQMLVKLCKFDI